MEVVLSAGQSFESRCSSHSNSGFEYAFQGQEDQVERFKALGRRITDEQLVIVYDNINVHDRHRAGVLSYIPRSIIIKFMVLTAFTLMVMRSAVDAVF
jgi:hypothetical protein